MPVSSAPIAFSPALCAILGLPVGTEMTYPQASRLFYAPDRAAVYAYGGSQAADEALGGVAWRAALRLAHLE